MTLGFSFQHRKLEETQQLIQLLRSYFDLLQTQELGLLVDYEYHLEE